MILTIFGYPQAGKTILFNILTNKEEKLSKYSASGNEFHKAVVDVPDERLDLLTRHFEAPVIHAKIEFLDTGAMSYGEVKNSTFVDLLRRGDGLVHIVRGFENPEILHPQGTIDPARDILAMEEELKTVDFMSLEKRLERLTLDLKKIKSKELQEEHDLAVRLKAHLESGLPLRQFPFTANEQVLVRGFKFLSEKPLLHLINTDENHYQKYLPLQKNPENQSMIMVFCGKIEQELLSLEQKDRQVFQEEYGLKDYHYIRDVFIQSSYQLMNLVSFFTVGKDECKAWTIQKNDTAFIAAGKIHSDIQQGFIRAEVINWKDFLDCGGFTQAKDKALLRLEGKEYIVRDGEIVHFRFNK